MIEYKDYRISMLGTFSLYEVKAKAQGQVPTSLRGLYTSETQAMQAIDSLPPKKEKTDGKAKRTV